MTHGVALWEVSEPCTSQGQQRLEVKSEMTSAGQGARRYNLEQLGELWKVNLEGRSANHQK